MKVNIKLLVKHFQKIGEVIFHYLFFHTKRSSNECACDTKELTLYENETDHFIWQGNVLEKLGF